MESLYIRRNRKIVRVFLFTALLFCFLLPLSIGFAAGCASESCVSNTADPNSPGFIPYDPSGVSPNDPSSAKTQNPTGNTVTTGSCTQGFCPLEDIGGLYTKNKDLGAVLNQFFRFGLGIAALLAVITITWGGFQYMTTDAIGDKKEGKEWITSAIYGLLIILFSYILLVTINPKIVNFSLFSGTTNSTINSQSTSGTSPTGNVPGNSNINTESGSVPTNNILNSTPGTTDTTVTNPPPLFPYNQKFPNNVCFVYLPENGAAMRYDNDDNNFNFADANACRASCNPTTLCKLSSDTSSCLELFSTDRVALCGGDLPSNAYEAPPFDA